MKVPKIDEIIIVTNDKFAHQFEDWIEEANYEVKLTGMNDSTSTNETRLGAIGDIQFIIDKLSILDGLLYLL